MTTFDLQRAAMSIDGASPPEKHVLLVLALRADNATAKCTPGIPSIARDTGLSERTVLRAVISLEKAGHISRHVRPGIGATYTVHPRHGVTTDTQSPVTERPETPDRVSPKLPRTTNSQKASPSSKRVRANLPIEIPSWIPPEAWSGWAEMRRAKGKRLTPRAIEIAIGKLQDLADDGQPPGEVLDQSTLNQWTGLFPLKDRQHGKSSTYRGSSLGSPCAHTAAVLAAHNRVSFEG